MLPSRKWTSAGWTTAWTGRRQALAVRTAERGHTLSVQQFESQATDARHQTKSIYDEKPN